MSPAAEIKYLRAKISKLEQKYERYCATLDRLEGRQPAECFVEQKARITYKIKDILADINILESKILTWRAEGEKKIYGLC
ncbi:uncharacterized protein LAJ45_03655 [Morchella importuna]|uniref:uncharacterized protein n=1 Tax=Morchella importuna TaxID=1174673 RepID=UPI001E8EEDD2|nr:uncharacterized protein LAJ45_03655 [Morchella importuna]KAH8152229.1 hypothetical protein LAJ45_03655 [Morchella importuna]